MIEQNHISIVLGVMSLKTSSFPLYPPYPQQSAMSTNFSDVQLQSKNTKADDFSKMLSEFQAA